MDQSSLQSLLADNQIDPDEFQKNPSATASLECFHFNLSAHPRFSAFTGLKEIRIIEQDIADLSFLKDLPNLAVLHVYNTLLENTDGLAFCQNVKTLILEGNKIRAFPDISGLKDLELLSVAENPLERMPEFPCAQRLMELNVASTNLSCVPPSIKNLKSLKVLNIADNHIHSFSSMNTLAKMQSLRVLYFQDPNYGTNPICEIPNYDIMVGCNLKQIDVIDTFTITKKFRSQCEAKKREVKLFYAAVSALDATMVESMRSEFYHAYGELMSDLAPTFGVSASGLDKIAQICNQFECNMKEYKFVAAELPMLSYKSAGLVRSTRLLPEYAEWSDFLVEISNKCDKSNLNQITAVWEVTNNGAELLAPQETPKNRKFVAFSNAKEVLQALDSWTEIEHDYIDLIPAANTLVFYVSCKISEVDHTVESFPEHLFMLSTSMKDQLKEIEQVTKEMAKSTPQYQEISTDTSLCVLQKSFSIIDSLINVTLIDCGLSSIKIFQNLTHLQSLNLMFNKIESLKDLPILPSLKNLDISFNIIENLNDLVPLNHEATQILQNIRFIGNPIYSPTTEKFIKQIFPNMSRLENTPVFYSPPQNDSVFLTLIPNHDTIQFLDLSFNCLTTLKPLSKLPHLTKLIASGNLLECLDITSQSLVFVDVSSNYITELPIQSAVPNLSFLVISHNYIRSLSALPCLLSLFVSSNEIESVPASSFFPNLIILSIENNPLLEEVDSTRLLFQFKTLKMLNGVAIKQAMHNKIQNNLNGILFQEEFSSMISPGQTILKLNDKNYKDVDVLASEIVQTLILSNNEISEIKWNKNAFPKLVQLDLSSNTLQSFDFLILLPLLRSLDLSNNKISDSICKQLSCLKLGHLKQVVLANNSLRTSPIFGRNNFPSLEILDLSHNYVSTIERGTFSDSILISLDLSYNSLKKLDGLGIASLASLDISHNRITTVDEIEKLRPCTSLQHFHFNDNPLNQRTIPRIRCLCILRSLKEMDGKPVTESDLIQVNQILEQNASSGIPSSDAPAPPGRTNRVTNIIMSPNLPSLREAPTPKRRSERPAPRFPR